MKRQKNSFRHESLQDQESVLAIMQALTDGLAKGKLTFSDDDDSLSLKPEGLLAVKLTASQEDNRNRINLRLSWESRGGRPAKKKALSVRPK